MAPDLETPTTFSDFPHDIHLNIVSFLNPTDISFFARTCRRFAALCSPSSPSSALRFALCDRRFGSKTQIHRVSALPFPRLYKTLERWETLIGFWRRVGNHITATPPLLFFQWSSTCVIGFRVSLSPLASSYAVCKTPFLWLGLSPAGETLSFLNPDNGVLDSEGMPVTISFIGCKHLLVEERVEKVMEESDELIGWENGSEIYEFFANRTSAGAESSMRRMRRKKVKERLGRRGWEAEHFYKILDYFPTASRPLQGLWKVNCPFLFFVLGSDWFWVLLSAFCFFLQQLQQFFLKKSCGTFCATAATAEKHN